MAAKYVMTTAEWQALNTDVAGEFRRNGGRVGGPFEGTDLLLLTTTGVKSGQSRLTPLVYNDVDGRILLVGSFAGNSRNPGWVHNVRADPRVHIEVRDESYDATASELPIDDRNAVFPRIVEQQPQFGDYQSRTDRVLPVFEISRR